MSRSPHRPIFDIQRAPTDMRPLRNGQTSRRTARPVGQFLHSVMPSRLCGAPKPSVSRQSSSSSGCPQSGIRRFSPAALTSYSRTHSEIRSPTRRSRVFLGLGARCAANHSRVRTTISARGSPSIACARHFAATSMICSLVKGGSGAGLWPAGAAPDANRIDSRGSRSRPGECG